MSVFALEADETQRTRTHTQNTESRSTCGAFSVARHRFIKFELCVN